MWPFRRSPPPPTTPATIRLTFINERSRPVTLSLEPLGYFFDVPPGQRQGAELTHNGHDQPHLEITLEEDAIAVWEELGDGQGLSPQGGHYGAEGPA